MKHWTNYRNLRLEQTLDANLANGKESVKRTGMEWSAYTAEIGAFIQVNDGKRFGFMISGCPHVLNFNIAAGVVMNISGDQF